MRVTTIDGGFRGRPARALYGIRGGLGSLTSAVQNSEADAFNGRMAKFDQAYALLQHAAAAGGLPVSQATALEAECLAISTERDAHRASLASLAGQAELMQWQSTADDIVARANALADHIGAQLGYTQTTRPWQIGVALVGGAVLFGGLAVAFSRMGKRTPKRRR